MNRSEYSVKSLGILLVLTASFPSVNAQLTSPTPEPVTQVQLVNTTSVPAISLSLNGRNSYPVFPQGQLTADAPTNLVKVRYKAESKKTGAVAESKDIEYAPNGHHSLIILGDFSTDVPPDTLRQPGPPPLKPEKPYPPNVIFRVYPHEKEGLPEFVRLRVINGMPGKTLNFSTPNQKITLDPGKEQSLTNQEPVVEYTAEVDGNLIPILVRQEGGEVRNAMLIFFLKEDGQPAFKRVFENR